MTAHLTVACTCHQCARRRGPSPPHRRAAAYDPSSSPRVPKPPTSARPPKRQAGAQSHPMSSAGSPAWASSQSRTPRRPSGPTRKLPNRKSPWTVTRGPAAGRCRSSQRTPSSSGGAPRPARRGRTRGRRGGRRSAARRSIPGRWCGWRPALLRTGTSGRAGPRSTPRRAGSRGMVSPSSHSTTSQSAPRSSPTPMATTAGTGTPTARAEEQRALHRDLPGLGAEVTAVHLEDGRAGGPRAPRLEHARDPRRAAREPVQVPYGPAEIRAERRRDLVATQRCHGVG